LIAPLVDVTLADDIKYKGFDTGVAGVSLDRFLVSVIGRKDKTVDDDGAVEDLCHPVVVGVYRFTDTLRGLAATLRGSRCGLSAAKTTGATFIDKKPDPSGSTSRSTSSGTRSGCATSTGSTASWCLGAKPVVIE